MIATLRMRVRPSSGSLHLEIFGRCLAAIGYQLILHVLSFIERGQSRLLDGRDVNKHVFAAAARLRLYKPVALGRIEPFHCASRHSRLLKKRVDALTPARSGGCKSEFSAVLRGSRWGINKQGQSFEPERYKCSARRIQYRVCLQCLSGAPADAKPNVVRVNDRLLFAIEPSRLDEIYPETAGFLAASGRTPADWRKNFGRKMSGEGRPPEDFGIKIPFGSA